MKELAEYLENLGRAAHTAHAIQPGAAPVLYGTLERIYGILDSNSAFTDSLEVWLNYPHTPAITPRSVILAALAKGRGEA